MSRTPRREATDETTPLPDLPAGFAFLKAMKAGRGQTARLRIHIGEPEIRWPGDTAGTMLPLCGARPSSGLTRPAPEYLRPQDLCPKCATRLERREDQT